MGGWYSYSISSWTSNGPSSPNWSSLSFSYLIFYRYFPACSLNLLNFLSFISLSISCSSRSNFLCISRFLMKALCLWSTPENKLFFFWLLGKTLAHGFQPIGFYDLGSTLLLKGRGPAGSGRACWPNSFGLLQSMTPLKLPIDALGIPPWPPSSATPEPAALIASVILKFKRFWLQNWGQELIQL